ncbi:MAG: hypothetical protein JWO06_1261, partial [Bacteroidota bacterium]|nr:hypothetical protein [Bacteroidota bacterium]
MTPEEIKDLCISSCKNYYDYLAKTGKGLNEIELWAIEIVDHAQRIVNVRLSKKIFDAETIFFRFAGDEKKYDGAYFLVLEYDVEKNMLYIEPNAELFPLFVNARATNVRVIADMKFLVQRVNNWFDQKGDNLQLPKKKSPLEELAKDFPASTTPAPSEDQLDAIKTILTQPFSYIWGAPGTGKTQLVLANVVIQYVKNKKRCAILAPTNTALEQVLKGVLRMSDAAGIPRDKFLRLGHTSKAFAEQYPEVCENFGITSQRQQIERQIKVVRSVMRKEDALLDDTLKQIEETTGKLKQLQELMDVASEKNTSQKLMKQMMKEVKKELSAHTVFESLSKSLDFETVNGAVSLLSSHVSQQKKDEAVLQAKAVEFSVMPEDELKTMLTQLESSRDKMKGSNERAKNALVVAATLDSFIYRFIEDDLEVEHIFLDEAGYACAIKAMPLMKSDVPVTFLGDHLQLPPVCEMNEMEMQDEKNRDSFIWSKSAIHLARMFDQTKQESCNAFFNNEESLGKGMARADLKHTHRFGRNLASVLNDYVYRNGFGSSSLRGETEIYFVHVETPVPQPRNENDKPTRESEAEVHAIRQFIDSTGISDYAILTPYINQVKLLGKQLPHDRNSGRILTVHGAQGKEWENVLLSVVDTDKKWFTDSRYAKSRGL